ncbi:hypothetical protein E4U19_007120 [Claviceps sp. Clav32 group G5]|nr:hypothetical protein E4U19_007120 [Claviceps sp. Clav32 group G5]
MISKHPATFWVWSRQAARLEEQDYWCWRSLEEEEEEEKNHLRRKSLFGDEETGIFEWFAQANISENARLNGLE